MPGDTKPHLARMEKKRKRTRKAGDLAAARQKLWQALTSAEEVLLSADDDALALRAVHAISQAAATYARLVEVGELEARMAELEAAIEAQQQRRPQGSRSAYGGAYA